MSDHRETVAVVSLLSVWPLAAFGYPWLLRLGVPKPVAAVGLVLVWLVPLLLASINAPPDSRSEDEQWRDRQW